MDPPSTSTDRRTFGMAASFVTEQAIVGFGFSTGDMGSLCPPIIDVRLYRTVEPPAEASRTRLRVIGALGREGKYRCMGRGKGYGRGVVFLRTGGGFC